MSGSLVRTAYDTAVLNLPFPGRNARSVDPALTALRPIMTGTVGYSRVCVDPVLTGRCGWRETCICVGSGWEMGDGGPEIAVVLGMCAVQPQVLSRDSRRNVLGQCEV